MGGYTLQLRRTTLIARLVRNAQTKQAKEGVLSINCVLPLHPLRAFSLSSPDQVWLLLVSKPKLFNRDKISQGRFPFPGGVRTHKYENEILGHRTESSTRKLVSRFVQN